MLRNIRLLSSAAVVGVAALLFAAGCAARSGEAPGDSAVSFQVLLQNSRGGVAERQFVVIRDAADFHRWWRRATSRRLPAQSPPEVDFSRNMVIALFMGAQRTGGNRISVAGVNRDGDTLTVQVRERSPGAGCMTTQALTQPFEIIETPAAAKVEFQTRRVSRRCR